MVARQTSIKTSSLNLKVVGSSPTWDGHFFANFAVRRTRNQSDFLISTLLMTWGVGNIVWLRQGIRKFPRLDY